VLDFTETYDEQLPRIYGYIAYRVGNRADAEDLTQQTFTRAFAHWPEFDSRRATVGTWLLAIARNLVIDHYRGTTQRPTSLALEDVGDAEMPRAAAPTADVGVSAELQTALSGLGERELELIALRYGADLSGPQISEITGLGLANVHQILSRALRKLRECLGGEVASVKD
jgi:RNA polymerase sigma factor (sigma-70 family)